MDACFVPRGQQKALYDALRQAIATGRLRPGARVPSSRDLAQQQGVARATVVTVYGQLTAEGYLDGRPGSGTYVSQLAPDDFFLRGPLCGTGDSGQAARMPRTMAERSVSLCEPAFPKWQPAQRPAPFAAHIPALDEFPRELWSRCVTKALRRLPASALGEGDSQGLRDLREAMAAYLNSARGVHCSADQILVVSGTQQALDLCARLLLSDGDTVVVEDPGYVGMRRILQNAGARVVPVPVDGKGLMVEVARQLAPRARLVGVTPAHQAPTGVVLHQQRRRELLAWAQASRAWVFEDDYDSEYRYAGRPIASLHGLDTDGCVLHAASFSKTMFPALRLGYLVLPADLAVPFAVARANLERYPSILHQAAMALFLNEGHYPRHLRRMRLLYAQRHAALLEAAHRHAPGLLDIAEQPAGLETVAWLPDDVDDVKLARRLFKLGLVVEPVTRSRVQAICRPGLVLGFAAFTPHTIDHSLAKLAGALKHLPRVAA